MIEIKTTTFGAQLDQVEFIWAKNSKEFLFSNSVLIHGNPCIIVDPSASFTYLERLASSNTVDMVLNTHYHADHRSLNGLFKQAIFAAHELDAPAIRDYKVYEKMADSDADSYYTKWRKDFFQKYSIKDCPVSKLYQGGEIIETNTTQIELVHIPGHTPGHLALHFKNIRAVFLSDIDLTPYGPWYANVESNIDDFIKSVKKIKSIDADYYISSHGERLYSPEKFHEKIDRFFNHFQARDEKILDLLKEKPMKLFEIAANPIIYRKGSLNDPLKAYFQLEMIKKHLERLIKLGEITLDNESYFIN